MNAGSLELPFPRSYWAEPGRLLAGCYPGDVDPVQAGIKLAGLIRCGVTHVVNLMEEHERDVLGRRFVDYRPTLEALASRQGHRVVCERRSIRDMNVPWPDVMRTILDTLDASIGAGGVVYVHCLAGRGRTGTVVGCYLVRHGLTGDQAIERLRALTKHNSDMFWPTPQTAEQREFVRNWSQGS